MKNSPIGVFDSGLGGLTVASEIARKLPHEPFMYLGDTLRCPYGPRDLGEVQTFVREICSWLVQREVKLIVIACNTGAAAGLVLAQQEFSVPIIGVIDPGARAAVQATRNRKVGIIGTEGTIRSQAYPYAIGAIDAGIEVFSVATPRFVEIVEEELSADQIGQNGNGLVLSPTHRAYAEERLAPLKEKGVDTLILGCTHYPLLASDIADIMGPGVRLVSSAEETAREVAETLARRDHLNDSRRNGHEFFTTGDVERFRVLGSRIFGSGGAIEKVEHISLGELAEAARFEHLIALNRVNNDRS